MTLRRAGGSLLALALLQGACGSESTTGGRSGDEPFSESAVRLGIDFRHDNGRTGRYYLPEIMGAGAALLDYDEDGDLDAFLVQGGSLLESAPDGNRLYRNDLTRNADGTTVLRFTDVSGAALPASRGYGMGVATGDVDNDGRIDLYVTGYGANQLLLNRGDGTFRDGTADTGTDHDRWSTSASFFDMDRDGWLDLYVCNYVDFRPANHKECRGPTGAADYCSPDAYAPLSDVLFRNRGNGTFEDVSVVSGIARERGAGLGVVAADLDDDGWPDLYVANDRMPNVYWRNRGDGTFDNLAGLAGVAVNAEGAAEASMGIAAGDFDADGDEDLFVTHLRAETNTLYVNDGTGSFADRSVQAGLGPPSLGFTGFGTSWIDLDNDGWLDLLVANGAVVAVDALAREADPFPYAQRNQVFANDTVGRFRDSGSENPAIHHPLETSRGVAVGDVDNDGDIDVLLTNNDGPSRLLINNAGSRNAWLGLRLVGGTGPRDMLGARVEIVRSGGPSLRRRVATDGSYASASDPRVLVGLGDAKAVSEVRVRWPDGTSETWRDPPLRRWTTIRQGQGQGDPWHLERAKARGAQRRP